MLIMALCCVFIPCAWAAKTTAIIANHQSDIDQLDEYDLMAIFSMRKQYWDNGLNIQIITLRSNHPLHQQFTLEHLGVLPYQLERGWSRNIFRGVGRKPIVVDSVSELIDLVNKTSGAIGYIDANIDIDDEFLRVIK